MSGMSISFLDLETRSDRDVTKVGVDRMAEGSLRILSAHYALGDGPVRTWRGAFSPGPADAEGDPAELLDAIAGGALVWAHNARFDRTIWNAAAPPHWPRIAAEQTRDSASLCRAWHLPASLKAATANQTEHKASNASFRALWSERYPMGEDARTLYEKMVAYGEQDVRAMRELVRKLPPTWPGFWDEWIASERVNDRGFLVDLPWCARASAAREALLAADTEALTALTDGVVRTPKQNAAARQWAEMLLGRGDGFTIQRKKRVGGDRAGFRTETRPGFDKAVRAELREELLEDPQGPAEARVLDVLDVLDGGAGAAIAKYDAVLVRHSADGRLRGSYIFRGASQTGRFSACVDSATQIDMSDGTTKRIDCIAVGDYVMSHRRRARRVEAVWRKGTADMIRVEGPDGQIIECTWYHEWLTAAGWRPVRECVFEHDDGSLEVAIPPIFYPADR